MTKTANPLDSAVRALAKKQKAKPLADAIGALVKARLAKPTPVWSGVDYAKPSGATPKPSGSGFGGDYAKPTPKAPRPPRAGRLMPYKATGKKNDARKGTWRHYMIATICAHEYRHWAEAEHRKCDNPKWAKNRLDFSWALKNGFIEI